MKIGIIGLGLIGGSLGLDFKAVGGHTVIGISRRPETCSRAIARGAVDEASTVLNTLTDTDIIFICTPIAQIQPTLDQLAPHLSPQTIVTDVGSVKAPIVDAAESVWPNFVGSHPMAGTTESGIEAAQSHLFRNRPYVITPTSNTLSQSIETLENLVRSLQALPYQCTPADHDRAVAWISHTPVMVSASLIAACTAEPNPAVLELAQKLASSGFRDTSRVGGGNPELGVMMAQYNQAALMRSLIAYRTHLDQIIDLIEHQNWAELNALLTRNQQVRPKYL